MRDIDYAFSVAYTNAYEPKTEDDKEKLIDEVFHDLKSVCPPNVPLDMLIYKNDYINLKTVIRAMHIKSDYSRLMIKPCLVDPKELFDSVKQGDYLRLPEFIASQAKEAYELMNKTGNVQLMEVYLDKELLKVMLKSAKKLENLYIVNWVLLLCDLANCDIILRGSKTDTDEEIIKTAIIDEGAFDKDMAMAAVSEGYEQAKEYVRSIYPDMVNAWENGNYEEEKSRLMKSHIESYTNRVFGVEPIISFFLGLEEGEELYNA